MTKKLKTALDKVYRRGYLAGYMKASVTASKKAQKFLAQNEHIFGVKGDGRRI